MNAEREPLEVVRTAVGSGMWARSTVFVVALVWMFTWMRIDIEVSIFGFFALSPGDVVALVGVVTIPFVYAELRARRVLSAVRVLRHQASFRGLDVWVRQLQLGSSAAPQRLRIGDGQLSIDDTSWDATSVTMQHELISLWDRGVPMIVEGHQLRLSVLPKNDFASVALWGSPAIDREFADAVDAALRAPRPSPR